MVSKQTKHLFLTFVIIIIISFIAGILVGFNIQTNDENSIQRFIKEAELNTESYLIEQEMIEISSKEQCELTSQRVSDLSDEIVSIGLKLNKKGAEENLGSENFNFLKRKYYIMQIKDYLFYKKLLDECDIGTDIILYYYSPFEEFDLGPLLSDLAIERDIKVFPVEFNFSNEIRFIESYYNIEKTPTIIVNYINKLEGKEETTKKNILELIEDDR